MKLPSSVTFLLDSDVKEYVYVYIYKPSQAITISKMVLFSVRAVIDLDCFEKVQIKKIDKKAYSMSRIKFKYSYTVTKL